MTSVYNDIFKTSPFPNILESGLSWIRHKELRSIIQLFDAVIENHIQQPLVHRNRKLPNISRNPDPCTQEDQVPGDQILGAGTYLTSAGTLPPVHKRTRSPGTRYSSWPWYIPNISRNSVPCTQKDQVPGNQILGLELLFLPVPHTGTDGRHQLFQLLQRLLRSKHTPTNMNDLTQMVPKAGLPEPPILEISGSGSS